jgi:hypothetical protein
MRATPAFFAARRRKLLDFAWMIPITLAILLVASATGGLLGG